MSRSYLKKFRIEETGDAGARGFFIRAREELEEGKEGNAVDIFHDGLLSVLSEGHRFGVETRARAADFSENFKKNVEEKLREEAAEAHKLRRLAVEREKAGTPHRILFVVGDNFSGKTTLVRKLAKEKGEFCSEFISHTTRDIRNGEKNGVDYYFVEEDDFFRETMFESVVFGGKRYGASIGEMRRKLQEEKLTLLVAEPFGISMIRNFLEKAHIPIQSKVLYMNPKNRLEILEKEAKESEVDLEELQARIKRGNIPEKLIEFGIVPDHTVTELHPTRTLEEVWEFIEKESLLPTPKEDSPAEERSLLRGYRDEVQRILSMIRQAREEGALALSSPMNQGYHYYKGVREALDEIEKKVSGGAESPKELLSLLREIDEKNRSAFQRFQEAGGEFTIKADREELLAAGRASGSRRVLEWAEGVFPEAESPRSALSVDVKNPSPEPPSPPAPAPGI